MTYTTSVIYLKCQTCQAKIHCKDCGNQLEETLAAVNGVNRIALDMPNQRLEAESTLSVDDFAELLEDHGLFSDL